MAPWLLLGACLKAPPPVVAATPSPVLVSIPVTVGTALEPAGPALREAIAEQVREHGLVPVDAPAGDAAVLELALAPRFSSQMAGRYRWTVDVTLSFVGPTFEQHATFDVPVALIYAHEREQAAADAAAPVLVREVGRTLDAAISAPTP